jgi:hypothetical protein
MKRSILILLAAMVVLGAFGSFAGAFTMSEKIVVSNELVAIVRAPAGGLSASERIDRVNDRLAYILGYEPLNPGAIRAVRRGNSRMIMVGNRLLVTVTPRDARANNTTVAGLTQVWLQNARDALPESRPTPSVPG